MKKRLLSMLLAFATAVSLCGGVSAPVLANEYEEEIETAVGSEVEVASEDVASLVSEGVEEETGEGVVERPDSEDDGVALSDDKEIVASGTCGDNLTYTLDSDGLLTISGSGDMYNYSNYREMCSGFSHDVKSVVIENGVTSIGEYAFYYCSSLTSIEIPSSVTSIGGYAFYCCSSLTSIEIPSSVTSIGELAFLYCSSLTSIEIPDSVTSIGKSAFRYCSSLTSMEIPGSVTSIGSFVFSGCSSLTSIIVDVNNRIYDSRNNCDAIIETSTNTLISGCNNTVIPSNVTSIGDGAFNGCSSLTSMEIPGSVTSIGESAFSDCRSLTSMEIPGSVTSIGKYAFSNCRSLTSMEIPGSVTSIGEYAFSDCSSLTSIEIPSSVTSIGGYAFYCCSSLTSVVIQEGVTSIGSYAFYCCRSLTSIEIPSSVTSIGSYAFDSYNYELVLYVEAGSYAEEYAIQKGLSYLYIVDAINIALVLPNYSKYVGASISVSFSNGYESLQYVENKDRYVFEAPEEAETFAVSIINSYGDILYQSEEYSVKNNRSVTLEDIKDVANYQVRIKSDTDNDTKQIGILWYDGETLYTKGTELKLLPSGKQLTGKFVLSEDMSFKYETPEDLVYTADSSVSSKTIFLTELEKQEVSSIVTVDGSPLSSAKVSVKQQAGEYEAETWKGSTDSDGSFSAEIPCLSGEVTISCKGYYNKTLSLEEVLEMEEISLDPLDGVSVQLSGDYVSEGKTSIYDNWDDVLVTVERNGEKISSVKQDSILTLDSSVTAGDLLTFTFSSKSKDFADISLDYSVNNLDGISISLEILQYGRIEATYEKAENEKVKAIIYDRNGNMIASSVMKSQAMRSELLEDGEYTLVLIGESAYLSVPASVQTIEEMGMQENKDFVKKQVSVKAGQICSASFDTIPLFDEEKFSYTDSSLTSFTSNKISVTQGNTVSFRAAADFKDTYRNEVTNIWWVIDIAEEGSCEYVDGTIALDRNPPQNIQKNSSQLLVKTEDPTQVLRFCLRSLQAVNSLVSCSLRFDYQGKTITQPVGSITLKIDELTISVPAHTNETRIPVSGTALVDSAVAVYDGDVLIGETIADKSGNWRLSAELVNPYTYTDHSISAEITTPSGSVLYTKSENVLYQYEEDPVTLKTVTQLSNNSSQKIIYDMDSGTVSSLSYSYNPYKPEFSFILAFDQGDAKRAENVILSVYGADGSVRTLYPKYNADKDVWTVSDSFATEQRPRGVYVSYSAKDKEYFVSSDQITDSEEQWEELFQLVSDSSNEGGTLLEELDLDFTKLDCSRIDDEEIIALTEDYNAEIDQLIELAEDYKETSDDLKDTMQSMSEYAASVSAEADCFSTSAFGSNFTTTLTSPEDLSLTFAALADGLDEMLSLEELQTGGVLSKSIKGQDGKTYEITMSDKELRVKSGNDTTILTSSTDWTGSFEADAASLSDFSNVNVMAESVKKLWTLLGKGLQKLESNLAALSKQEMRTYLQSSRMIDAVNECQIKDSSLLPEWNKFKDQLKESRIKKSNEWTNVINTQKRVKSFGQIFAGINILYDIKEITEAYEKITTAYEIKKEGHPLEIDKQDSPQVPLSAAEKASIIQELNVDINNVIGLYSYQMALGMISLCTDITTVLSIVGSVGTGGISIVFAITASSVKKVAMAWAKETVISSCLSYVSEKYYNDMELNDMKLHVNPVPCGCSSLCTMCNRYCVDCKCGEETPPDPYPSVTGIIDPSGYVYEAVLSNRVEGAIATLIERQTLYDIYEEAYTEDVEWDASAYGQMNPLLTNEDGSYQWDVPDGLWQVQITKDGYETAYSDWLQVPPPQLDVNIGIVSYETPMVDSIICYQDSVRITFSKYMDVESLTKTPVTIKKDGAVLTGSWIMTDEEEDPENPKKTYVRTIEYCLDKQLQDGDEISLIFSSKMLSYSGTGMEETVKTATAIQRVEDLQVKDISVTEGQETDVIVKANPAGAAKGHSVEIISGASMLFDVDQTSAVLDQNGEAVFHVKGSIAGVASIQFILEGTELTAESLVKVVAVCTNHSWDQGEITVPASINAEGVKTYTCTICKETKTEAIPKLTERNPGPAYENGKWVLYDENLELYTGSGTPIVNGKKYYVQYGELKSGWLHLSNWQMYFYPDTFAAAIGIVEVPNKEGVVKAYMFDKNGVEILKSRTEVIDGKKYWFQPDGSLMSGWCTLGDWKMYFFPKTYYAATGLVEIDGVQHIFNLNYS